MKRSALLEFESSMFATDPHEDEETNPGVFGRSLAAWVAEQVRARDYSPDELIAEDFGWCVPVACKPYRLYVACASADETARRWQVFIFAEGGLLSRVLGRDGRQQAVSRLFAELRKALHDHPRVSELAEVNEA